MNASKVKGSHPMKYYLGLDVHSKQTSYCLQDEKGTVVAEGSIPASPEGYEDLKRTHKIPDGTMTALESGSLAMVTVRILYELGYEPVVVNAEEVRRKARRVGQKTDSRDAFDICEGLRRGMYDSIVYIPEPGVARIRAILSRRRHYIKLRTMEINAAKFILRTSGYQALVKSLKTEKAWMALFRHPSLPADLYGDLRRHFMTWVHVSEMAAEIEAELEEAVKPYEKIIDRLRTVPGVGPLTAATYFATLGRIERFPDSDHVVSYLGLAPSMYDSGSRERHGRITKRGSSSARTILCEAAQQAAKPLHPLRPYFMKIFVKQGRKKAIVAIAHRLARILYQVWKKGEDFDARKLNVERICKEHVEEKYVIKGKVTTKA